MDKGGACHRLDDDSESGNREQSGSEQILVYLHTDVEASVSRNRFNIFYSVSFYLKLKVPKNLQRG